MGVENPYSDPRFEVELSISLEESLLEVSPKASDTTLEQEQALVEHLEEREAAVASKDLLEALQE